MAAKDDARPRRRRDRRDPRRRWPARPPTSCTTRSCCSRSAACRRRRSSRSCAPATPGRTGRLRIDDRRRVAHGAVRRDREDARRGGLARLGLDGERVDGPVRADDDRPELRTGALQLDRPAGPDPAVRTDARRDARRPSRSVPAAACTGCCQGRRQAGPATRQLSAFLTVARDRDARAPSRARTASRASLPATDRARRPRDRARRNTNVVPSWATIGTSGRPAMQSTPNSAVASGRLRRGGQRLAVTTEGQGSAPAPHRRADGHDDPPVRSERGPGCKAVDHDRPPGRDARSGQRRQMTSVPAGQGRRRRPRRRRTRDHPVRPPNACSKARAMRPRPRREPCRPHATLVTKCIA